MQLLFLVSLLSQVLAHIDFHYDLYLPEELRELTPRPVAVSGIDTISSASEFKNGPAKEVKEASPAFQDLQVKLGNATADQVVSTITSNNPIVLTILSIVNMIFGLAFAFKGHKLFRPMIAFQGTIAFGIIAYTFVMPLVAEKRFGDSSTVVGWLIIFGVALVGGLLLYYLYKLALFFLGLGLGYIVSQLLINVSQAQLSKGVLVGITLGTMIIFVVLVFVFEKILLIIGTSLMGSISFFNGLDYWVGTGFTLLFRNALQTGQFPTLSTYGYLMLGGSILLAVAGAAYQWYDHRKDNRVGYQKGVAQEKEAIRV